MTSVIVPDSLAGCDAEVSHLPFHPEQLPAVLAMLGRCSGETLFMRFHGATDGTIHALDLARRSDHRTLGAWNGPDCIGLATLAQGEESNELGVLVQDSWQRRGIGTALLRGLTDVARASGIADLRAEVLAENRWVLAILARIGALDTTARWGVYSVTVRVMTPARSTELGRQHVDHSRTQAASLRGRAHRGNGMDGSTSDVSLGQPLEALIRR